MWGWRDISMFVRWSNGVFDRQRGRSVMLRIIEIHATDFNAKVDPPYHLHRPSWRWNSHDYTKGSLKDLTLTERSDSSLTISRHEKVYMRLRRVSSRLWSARQGSGNAQISTADLFPEIRRSRSCSDFHYRDPGPCQERRLAGNHLFGCGWGYDRKSLSFCGLISGRRCVGVLNEMREKVTSWQAVWAKNFWCLFEILRWTRNTMTVKKEENRGSLHNS